MKVSLSIEVIFKFLILWNRFKKFFVTIQVCKTGVAKVTFYGFIIPIPRGFHGLTVFLTLLTKIRENLCYPHHPCGQLAIITVFR
jgi:hypothetical protein